MPNISQKSWIFLAQLRAWQLCKTLQGSGIFWSALHLGGLEVCRCPGTRRVPHIFSQLWFYNPLLRAGMLLILSNTLYEGCAEVTLACPGREGHRQSCGCLWQPCWGETCRRLLPQSCKSVSFPWLQGNDCLLSAGDLLCMVWDTTWHCRYVPGTWEVRLTARSCFWEMEWVWGWRRGETSWVTVGAGIWGAVIQVLWCSTYILDRNRGAPRLWHSRATQQSRRLVSELLERASPPRGAGVAQGSCSTGSCRRCSRSVVPRTSCPAVPGGLPHPAQFLRVHNFCSWKRWKTEQVWEVRWKDAPAKPQIFLAHLHIEPGECCACSRCSRGTSGPQASLRAAVGKVLESEVRKQNYLQFTQAVDKSGPEWGQGVGDVLPGLQGDSAKVGRESLSQKLLIKQSLLCS